MTAHHSSAAGGDLPELGVGLVFMPGLADAIATSSDLIDFIEVEPQQHWRRGTTRDAAFRLDEGAFAAIAAHGKPCLVHSVACPIAGTTSLLEQNLAALRTTIARLDPPWVSEHLSFNTFALGDAVHHAGFLLPPLPCAASVDIAVQRLRSLRRAVARPIVFETGVNYLQALPGECSDGAFVRAVAEQADCGILLDLHNAWTNARNGRQPLQQFVDELPLERVVELHLAGGESLDGYWLDAHSGLVSPELLQFAAALVPRLPNLRAITFEMMDEAMLNGACDSLRLREQLVRLRALWGTRGTAATANVSHRMAPETATATERPLPTPGEWERTLGVLATGLERNGGVQPDSPLAQRLRADPGLAVLRKLIEAVRAGTVIDTLRLSARLLVLGRDRNYLAQQFAAHWRSNSPLPIATDEAIRFGEHLLATRAGIPGLDDLLRLEMAACRALADGGPVRVTLSRDPADILDAMARGELPAPAAHGLPVTLELAAQAE